MRQRQARSCGCLNSEQKRQICIDRNTTHGQGKRNAQTRTYRIWSNLSARPRKKCYADVRICNRWRSFENFLSDMGACPSDKHTLDRIENSKGYEPDNCRWATMKEQQNNRTNNRILEYAGKHMTAAQWAEAIGIHVNTLSQRINRLGWSIERALTTPARKHPRQASAFSEANAYRPIASQ